MKISYAEYIKKTSVSVLVAETVFNELLTSSPIKTIKDIADTTSGGTPLRSNPEYYNGEIPWLKSGELNDGLIDKATEFITDKGLGNSSAKLHPKGTLLVAMYGATAGKTGIINFEASTNQAICAVFPKEEILKDYLFWFFRSHRYQFIEKSKGGAQPNISQTVIKKTIIPVPNIEIQKQIVDILHEIETKNSIEVSIIPEIFKGAVVKILNFKNSFSGISTQLTHQLDLVKQLRQSFLREAMQGKLLEQNQKDEPATELLAKIKAEKEQLIKEKKIKKQKPLPPISEDEIPFDIPENWVWCRLGEVANNIHYGFNASAKPNKDEVRLLRITDIQNNKVEWSTVPGCDFSEKDLKSYLLKENDIVIARTGGTIGKSYIVKDITVKSLFASYLIRVIPNSLTNADFLKLFLESPNYWEQLYEAAWGAGQPNVNATKLNSLILSIPPLFEQKRIVAKLDKLMTYCDSLEESIKNSQTQNEMLLGQVLREALEPKEKEVVV